jgi:flagellar hook-basal body complex protein FliE
MDVLGVSAATLARGAAPGSTSPLQGGSQPGSGFARTFEDILGKASAQDAQADKALQELATGQTDNLHSVTLAAARADLSFRLVMEIRNRLQEAYQEVMRMQV